MSLPAHQLSARLTAPRALFAIRQNGTVAATRSLHNLLRNARQHSITVNGTFRQRFLSDFSLDSHHPLRLTLPASQARLFSTNPPLFEAQRNPDHVNDPPQPQGAASAKGETAQEGKTGEDSKDDTAGSTDSKQEKKKQQEEKAPPPPHGDKSPWQVFTETLSTEFKASKEWNESTKALSAGAHQFSESESVKRARAAASRTSGVVDNTLKSTGQALGKGAAWTWDTAPVRGVRMGANALGTGVDKATKPIRETAAFKSVKEAMDDGSSSRYGGWQDKEERRKARELRELNDIKSGKRRPIENVEEDPE
jgi:import inner membrane translocase subunit TIM44